MAQTLTELLVIGGGPAGLSAALMFSRTRRSCILYDSGRYRNVSSLVSHTVAGFDGATPSALREAMRKDILGYKTAELREGKIVRLSQIAGGFEAEDESGKKVITKKIVLATGLTDVLPNIPGLEAAWGKRAIHCIFCHGTETANAPMGFLVTRPNKMMNPKLVESIFKLWSNLNHTEVYIFTNGMDPSVPQDLEDSGLSQFMSAAKKRGIKIVSEEIKSIDSSPSTLIVKLADSSSISVPHLLVFPEAMKPNSDAIPLLSYFTLSPMGAIPPLPADLPAVFPPRMGDDPRTSVPGLFWAGNSGSPMGNITLSVAQGQMAGVAAAEEIGNEELRSMA